MMRNETLLRVAPLLAAVLLAAPARAHHSSAMFNDKKTMTITGTVSRYEWSNPHVYVYIKQLQDTGQSIEWELECSPPSILNRLGWSRDTLHVGDTVSVSGNPSRVPTKRSMLPVTITLAGQVLFERKGEVKQLAVAAPDPSVADRAGGTSAPAKAGVELAGVWVTLLDLKVANALEDTKKLPLTAAGKAADKSFDEKKMHPGAQCIAMPAPFFMVTPDLKRISKKADGTLLIEGSFDAAQRIVHLDTSNHEGVAQSTQGHSIGHWENGTLVIDTAMFSPHLMGVGYGIPSSPQKRLLERLTPAADGTSLTYHFEMSDPVYLTKPVKGDLQWAYRPSLAYAPPPCDLQNAKRYAQP